MADAMPPTRLVQIKHVQFDGDELIAAVIDGEGVAIPVRLVCVALGLDVQTQSDRLRDHAVLAQGLRIVRVPIGGRQRSVVAILHRYIAFWLATITPSQVNDESRPKLVRYQSELVGVLDALYGTGGGALIPTPAADPTTAHLQQRLAEALHEVRTIREALLTEQRALRAEVTTQGERLTSLEDVVDELRQIIPISPAQAEYINRAIKRLASRYKQRTGIEIFDRLWAQFKIDLGAHKYDALPAVRYEAALEWLREKAATLLPGDGDVLPPVQEQLL